MKGLIDLILTNFSYLEVYYTDRVTTLLLTVETTLTVQHVFGVKVLPFLFLAQPLHLKGPT
jgi:hypothetical protein